jgi:hypothetical protein
MDNTEYIDGMRVLNDYQRLLDDFSHRLDEIDQRYSTYALIGVEDCEVTTMGERLPRYLRNVSLRGIHVVVTR